MWSESELTAIGELVEFAIGGGWGNDPHETLEDGEQLVQVIRGTDIPAVQYGHLGQSPFRVETKRSVEKRTLQAGDIVLEISGGSSAKGQTTGRTCLITSVVLENAQAPLIPASFCRLVRLKQEMVFPEFAYYWLQEMYKSGRAGEYENRSTGISNFQFKVFLEREKLRLPAMAEQKDIALTLRAIDDKIANNRTLAADLEAMARAIFKSWFVDFDPVKAKMDGRAPAGMDAETAALFPDELVESELGLIPKGWVPSSIGDVADNVKSGVRADTIDPDEPYVALEHFEKACLSLFAHARGQDATSNKTRFEAGDLLFGKLRPYFHKVAIAPFDGVCSTDVLAIRPKSTQYASYTYCAFSNKSVVDYVTNLSGGTRMPRTNWKQLASYPAAIPPVAVANAFNLVAAPMLGFVADVGAENLELSRLRDILLPRLISGKLRLPDSSDQSLAEGD
jgi:type I restriction enzyme, S subunit